MEGNYFLGEGEGLCAVGEEDGWGGGLLVGVVVDSFELVLFMGFCLDLNYNF